MTQRIGIFICECGRTLTETLDLPRVARTARRWNAVALVDVLPFICKPDADTAGSLVQTIRAHQLDRIVFAGCSPREHAATFRRILTDAGLNPYLMQTANIREQCAWTIHDPDRATAKAVDLIHGAVRRVRHHEPLTPREIDCQPDVLVVGAGVAGISAARTLSQEGRRVFVVERSPCIGGRVALYEDLFPDLNCAACLLEPDLDALLHDDRITLFTMAEVTAAKGYAGNFSVSIRQAPRRIDPQRCIGCGTCLSVCPESHPNEYNAALDQRAAVFIPYPGALPHLAAVDGRTCRHLNGIACTRCQDACPFDAVDFGQTATTRTLSVGAIILATGFQGFDPAGDSRYGGGATDVITAFAFERLVNTTGPTGGSILTAAGRPPASVALIHCVGSRSEATHAYCSGVCCSHALKHAHQVKAQLPDTAVHLFFADLCLPGKTAQRFFDSLRDHTGVHLHRMARPDAVRIDRKTDQNRVRYTTTDGRAVTVDADLVILATAVEPSTGTGDLARRLEVELDQDGFFMEAHRITAPVASSRQGIYLAGCCQGPKTAAESVTQGQAAAGQVLQVLVPGGKIMLTPTVAAVDERLCAGCRTCESLCPYGAIVPGATAASVEVEATLCRGCGICAAACPCGAIRVCHNEADTICAEIGGVLASDGKATP